MSLVDYAKIRDALNATGRPIFFSTCGHSPGGGGIGNRMAWVGPACAGLANACRIASDVRQWGNGTFGTAKAVNLMAEYGGKYSVAGAWPDPDLLFSYPAVGGDNELTCKGAGVLAYCTGSFCDPAPENSRAQYALWSILGAPLLLSFDVRLLHTDPRMKATYTNPEIIAINQDSGTDGALPSLTNTDSDTATQRHSDVLRGAVTVPEPHLSSHTRDDWLAGCCPELLS